jgi:hypothetical protein
MAASDHTGQQFSAYDERPGFRKSSGQGYLFRNQAPAMGPNQYPRGYTPERMQDVRANMPPVANMGGQVTMGVRLSDEDPNPGQESDYTARAFARSQVPAEHLKGVTAIYTSHPSHGNAGHYTMDRRDPSKGTIEMTDSAVSPVKGPTRRATRKARQDHADRFERTAVHENGHHMEDVYRPTSLAGMEATAENYADKYTSPGNTTKPAYDRPQAQQNLTRRGGNPKDYQELRQAGTMPWEALPGQKPRATRSRKRPAA